jgi:hypothetical protein
MKALKEKISQCQLHLDQALHSASDAAKRPATETPWKTLEDLREIIHHSNATAGAARSAIDAIFRDLTKPSKPTPKKGQVKK